VSVHRFVLKRSIAVSSHAAFTINSLLPGYSYTGPSGVDDSNMCKCNTIAYSLISACDACQSETWITYGFIVSFKALRNDYLLSGGLNIRSIVQGLFPLRREIPVVAETLPR